MLGLTWLIVPKTNARYLVSEIGHVLDRIKLTYVADGSNVLNLYFETGRRTINRGAVVLLAFVGEPPEGKECCHKDDNKSNNVLTNLYYGTRRDNIRDQLRNSLHNWLANNRDESWQYRVITPELAEQVYVLQAAGISRLHVADLTGLSYSSVRDIFRRRDWYSKKQTKLAKVD